MTPEVLAKLRKSVMAHEGLRLFLYTDTTGHMTIGWGHNLSDVPITRQVANLMLDNDLTDAVEACEELIPVFKTLDATRQCVLAEMALNMGINTLLTFKRMLRYVEEKRFDKAAEQMLKSKWASQVGNRAHELAESMERGI